MNEFDLIKKYLERSGAYRLKNYYYYNEGKIFNVDSSVNMGQIVGIQSGYCYCFGNVQVSIGMNAIVDPDGANKFEITMQTSLPGLSEAGLYESYLAIGAGLNLLLDASYYGYKRFYGVGFNKISFHAFGIGAAAYQLNFNFNGYIFILR